MGDSSNPPLARFGSDFYRWIIQVLPSSGHGYTRLRRENSRRRRVRFARLGRRRSLKLKRFPRLKFRWLSPFALLAKLRDAYVDLMLATSSRITSTESMAMGTFAPTLFGRMRAPFGEIQAKEYDTKILVELYKSMAQNQNEDPGGALQIHGAKSTDSVRKHMISNATQPISPHQKSQMSQCFRKWSLTASLILNSK